MLCPEAYASLRVVLCPVCVPLLAQYQLPCLWSVHIWYPSCHGFAGLFHIHSGNKFSKLLGVLAGAIHLQYIDSHRLRSPGVLDVIHWWECKVLAGVCLLLEMGQGCHMCPWWFVLLVAVPPWTVVSLGFDYHVMSVGCLCCGLPLLMIGYVGLHVLHGRWIQCLGCHLCLWNHCPTAAKVGWVYVWLSFLIDIVLQREYGVCWMVFICCVGQMEWWRMLNPCLDWRIGLISHYWCQPQGLCFREEMLWWLERPHIIGP